LANQVRPIILPREIKIMTKQRKIIVHIGTSADGYIARPGGDLEWLTSRCAERFNVPLELQSLERFEDGLVQRYYRVL